MVHIELKHVQGLRDLIEDASVSMASRSLAVRHFCNNFKASAPEPDRKGDHLMWTKVDTEHLLAISSDHSAPSNYLVERVVAAE